MATHPSSSPLPRGATLPARQGSGKGAVRPYRAPELFAAGTAVRLLQAYYGYYADGVRQGHYKWS
jgi:hypothetical protein